MQSKKISFTVTNNEENAVFKTNGIKYFGWQYGKTNWFLRGLCPKTVMPAQ